MGLILTTSLLIFMLILEALRNQISIQLEHKCMTKKDKEEKQESEQNGSYQKQENPIACETFLD